MLLKLTNVLGRWTVNGIWCFYETSFSIDVLIEILCFNSPYTLDVIVYQSLRTWISFILFNYRTVIKIDSYKFRWSLIRKSLIVINDWLWSNKLKKLHFIDRTVLKQITICSPYISSNKDRGSEKLFGKIPFLAGVTRFVQIS